MELPGLNEQPRVTGRMATPAMPKRPPAFDLKGVMAPLTVLRLRSSDIQMVDRQLRVRISQLPHMFLHAPVMIDLGALEEASPLTVIQVVAILKACKLVPVAATNVPEAMRATIANEGLGILQVAPSTARERDLDAEIAAIPDPDKTPLPEQKPAEMRPKEAAQKVFLGRAVKPLPPPAPAPAPFAGPVVVRQAVRGGQVIYAQNSDLVVLAPVNAGAQVVADGHVHIYAKLRGRAVAGAKGLRDARIFCQKLEAELVAVSDVYMSADEIPPALRGKPVQIWSENGECKAAPL